MYYRPLRLVKLFGIVLCLLIIIYQLYRSLNPFWKQRSIRRILSRENHSKVEQISTMKEKLLVTKRIKSGEDYEEISYRFEPFIVRLPNFPDKEAKEWFYNCNYYKINSLKCPENSCETNGVLFDEEKHHLAVRLSFVQNGLYLDDDCGYNYGDIPAKRRFHNENEATVIYEKAFIYTVPDGWSFQHFLDGIGPKLSHSYQYLSKYPDAKVLIQRGGRFDRSVKEIWAMLGSSSLQKIFEKKKNFFIFLLH